MALKISTKQTNVCQQNYELFVCMCALGCKFDLIFHKAQSGLGPFKKASTAV